MWKRNISICNYFISGYWKYTKCSVPHVWAESKCSRRLAALLVTCYHLQVCSVKSCERGWLSNPRKVFWPGLYIAVEFFALKARSLGFLCVRLFLGCESHLTICRYISCAVGAKRDQSAGRRLPTDRPHHNPPQPTILRVCQKHNGNMETSVAQWNGFPVKCSDN